MKFDKKLLEAEIVRLKDDRQTKEKRYSGGERREGDDLQIFLELV